MAIGTALRFPVLFYPHLGMEDLFAIALRGESVRTLAHSAASSGQAPFFNIFYGLWANVSDSPVWLATPVFLISLAIIYGSYKVGRDIFGEKAGLWISYLVATSPFLIYFTGKIRYEYFVVAAALGAFYYSFRIINGKGTFKEILFYMFFSTLGVYNLYYFLSFIAAFNFWFLIKRKNALMWISAQIGVFLLFTPWLFVMMRQIDSRTGAPVPILEALRTAITAGIFNVVDFFATFYSGAHVALHNDDIVSKSIFIMSVLLLAVGFVAALKVIGTKETPGREAIVFALFVQLTSASILFFMNFWKHAPVFSKYAIGFAPIQYIITGSVVAELKNKAALVFFATITLIFAMSLSQYYPAIMKPPGTAVIMSQVAREEKNGDVILTYPSFYEHELAYYYDGHLKIYGLPKDHDMVNDITGVDDESDAFVERISEFSKYERIWILFPNEKYLETDTGRLIIKNIENLGFASVLEKEYLQNAAPENAGILFRFQKPNKITTSKNIDS